MEALLGRRPQWGIAGRLAQVLDTRSRWRRGLVNARYVASPLTTLVVAFAVHRITVEEAPDAELPALADRDLTDREQADGPAA